MKQLTIVLAIGVITGLAAVQAQNGGSADTLLARARHAEVVDGDVRSAITQYQAIVESFKTIDRHAAAVALLQMARSYERIGRPAARDAYETILRDYADQPNEVNAARAGLAVGAERSPLGLVCTNCSDGVASISRDGRWIVMPDWSSGDLVVGELKTGKKNRLMLKPGSFRDSDGYAEDSAFSPNGREIAFTWGVSDPKAPGQLRIVKNERGAPPRTLVNDPAIAWPTPVAWSADGRRLLVEMKKPDKTWQLGWVTVANGALTIIKTLDEGRVVNRVSLSPDSRYIAYSALASRPTPQQVTAEVMPRQSPHIYVIGADGQGEIDITQVGHDAKPAWSSDGSYLVFESTRAGSTDLWAVAMRGGKTEGQPVMVRRGLNWNANLGVTATNVLYYEAIQQPFNEVAVAHLDMTGTLPANARVAERFVGQNPSWSPDGRLLQFARPLSTTTADTDYDVIVHSFATGEDRKYSHVGLRNSPVRWLRDGTGFLDLLFRPAAQGSERAWSKIGVTIAAFETLTAFPAKRSGAASLSPDDKTMYHFDRAQTVADPFSQVVAVDLSTGRERVVVTLPGARETLPQTGGVSLAVSPDGRTLALLLLHPQTTEAVLATVGVDGTSYREVFKGFKLNRPAADRLSWTSDGRSLIFAMQSSGISSRLMRIGIQGGQPEFTGLEVEHLGSFSVSGDNQRIAYHHSVWRGNELWALDLSSALPKRR